MSTEAIQQVIQELESLPESDQRLILNSILNFLATLKQRRRSTSTGAAVQVDNPALAVKNGLLVFTGKVDAPVTDWVQWERDEHDKELLEAATGRKTHT